MDIDISAYRLSGKRMTGNTLKLFFKNQDSEISAKVLELKNLTAFIDNFVDHQPVKLTIGDKAGSYGLDMALQLKRPEIKNFKEVFIFRDEMFADCVFRALAENVIWRDVDNHPSGDKNY